MYAIMFVAECLSARLLILQSMFSWLGVAPTSVLNAIKGVACAQTSVLLRNAIKRSCLQKSCVYTQVQRCSGASGLSQCQNAIKLVMRARKKELGD